MVAGVIPQREISVHIITDEFLLQGNLHFKGLVQVILNNEAIDTLSLYQTHAYALDAENVAVQMNAPELVLVRSTCQIITWGERLSQEDYTLRPETQSAIVYTSRFAVQGNLAMGPEDRFQDVLEDLKGFFLVMQDATLHPLFPVRCKVPRQAPMVMIHRDHIKMMQEKRL